MTPPWLIRCATRREAGAGHAARCVALAAALPGPVRFFVDPGPGAHAMIEGAGFPTVTESSFRSSARLLDALTDGGAVFDGYDLDDAALAEAARRGFSAVLVDDGRARPGAVNVAPGFAPAPGPGALAGPEYALLGEAFASARDRALVKPGMAERAERVLVTFGARDSADRTTLALDALARLMPAARVTVVIGGAAAHRAKVEAAVSDRTGARLILDAQDMIPIHEQADFAIGAPGVSLLERLCCGLPGMILCQNQDQIPIAGAAAASGAVVLSQADNAQALADDIGPLLADGARRAALRARGLALIDGRGARRLAEALVAARAAWAREVVP